LSRTGNQLRVNGCCIIQKGHAIVLPFAVKSVVALDEVVQLELASVFG